VPRSCEGDSRVEFNLPASLAAVGFVSRLAEGWADCAVGDDAAAAVRYPFALVVVEAFTNAVRHAQPARLPRVIVALERLGGSATPALARVEVCDFGPGFDLAAVRPPDLDAGPESRLGLWLVRKIAQRMEYERATLPEEPNRLVFDVALDDRISQVLTSV